MMNTKIIALALALAPLAACGRADTVPPPPPWHLPTFDGQTEGRDKPPTEPMERAERPNAEALFDLALTCYPSPSMWQPEVHLQAGSTRRQSGGSSGDVVSLDGAGGNYVGVVFRMPLYSASEIDRERQRELQRREKAAIAVADFEAAVVERANASRELALLRAVERRSGQRVAVGVADTGEQIGALKEVAKLEGRIGTANASITRSRLTLIGMCKDRNDITAFLDRWAR